MFDNTYKTVYAENEVEYGCIVGNNKIVYIKAGMGGSYLGYEDNILTDSNEIDIAYDKVLSDGKKDWVYMV